MKKLRQGRIRIKEDLGPPRRFFPFLQERAVVFLSGWKLAWIPSRPEWKQSFGPVYKAGLVLQAGRVVSWAVAIPQFKGPGRTLYPSELAKGSSALFLDGTWDAENPDLIRIESTLLPKEALPSLARIFGGKAPPRRAEKPALSGKPLRFWEVREGDLRTDDCRGFAHGSEARIGRLLRTGGALQTLARTAGSPNPVPEFTLEVAWPSTRGMKIESVTRRR